MPINRDPGALQQVALRPAAQTAPVAAVRPTPRDASSPLGELLQGLGGMSDAVKQLGAAYLSSQKQQRDDPEAKRNAYARAHLEAARTGNDPDAIIKLHAGAAGETENYRTGLTIAAATGFASRKKDQWQEAFAKSGAGAMDWDKALADAVNEGTAAGYFKTDEAKSAFIEDATRSIEAFRVSDRDRQNSAMIYGDAKALATETTSSFTAALEKDGAPAAQTVLAGLWSNERFAKLTPEQKDSAIRATIGGIVQSGNVRAFSALTTVDGPDGIPLRNMPGIAENWAIWEQAVKSNADKLSPEAGTKADQDAAGKSTLQILDLIKGTPAGDFVRQKHLSISAGQAFATEAVKGLNDRMAKDGTATVDIDKELSDAVAKGKELGIFSDDQPDAYAAFEQSFRSQTAGLKAAQTNAANQDARAQTMDQIGAAAQSRFNEAMAKGGPAAATEALKVFAQENQALRDAGYGEQIKLFGGLAQGYAGEGNLKAVEALGNLPVDDKGTTLATANQARWGALVEGAKNVADSKRRDTLRPLIDQALGKAMEGDLTDEDITTLKDQGAENSDIARLIGEQQQTLAAFEKQRVKAEEERNRRGYLDTMRVDDTKLILGGRGDRIGDFDAPLAPGSSSEKSLKLTTKERWDNAMNEVDRIARVEFNVAAKKKGEEPDPKQRDAFARRRVLEAHAKNGKLDEQTEKTLSAFLGKVQFGGHEVTQGDLQQLDELHEAFSIYSPALIEKAVGSGGGGEVFYKSLMLGLESGLPPQEAIQQARTVRDTPWNERPVPSGREVNDAIDSVKKKIGDNPGLFNDEDMTQDRQLDPQIEAIFRKNYAYATSVDQAVAATANEMSRSYVRVGNRSVRFTDFGVGAGAAQTVLKWAAEQYAAKHSKEAPNGVEFDNGPNGSLFMFDALTGLPLTYERFKFSDLASSYDATASEERKKWDADEGKRREAEALATAEFSERIARGSTPMDMLINKRQLEQEP